MTTNQLKYREIRERETHNTLSRIEQERHNKAVEAESYRSNTATESYHLNQLAEQRRSAMANEILTQQRNAEIERSNRASEQNQLLSFGLQAQQLSEQRRSNMAREGETFRSNVAKEMETTRSNKAREAENYRSNKASELLTSKGQSITAEHNKTMGTASLSNALANLGNVFVRSASLLLR